MKKIALLLLSILITPISHTTAQSPKEIDLASHFLWTIPAYLFTETPSDHAASYQSLKFALEQNSYFDQELKDANLKAFGEHISPSKPVAIATIYTFFSWLFSSRADAHTEYITVIKSKNGLKIALRKQYLQAFCKMFAAQAAAQTFDSNVAAFIAGFATSLGIEIWTR